jgi:hypothetical protein
LSHPDLGNDAGLVEAAEKQDLVGKRQTGRRSQESPIESWSI